MSHKQLTLRAFALLPLVSLSACTTTEIEQLKRQNEMKRTQLTSLHEIVDRFDEELVATSEQLLEAREALREAARDSQLSRKDRLLAESKLNAQSTELATLRRMLAEKKAEANKLSDESVSVERREARRREIRNEIGQLGEQVDALSAAIENHMETRASSYRRSWK